MSQVPIFHGRITAEGRFELAEDERDRRRAFFQTLAGKNVEIVVRKERTRRSLDQNAYLHAVPFPMLREYLGYESIEDLKLALMGECWGYRRDKATGRELPLKPHTSDMTTEECTRFIEWLVTWAQTKFDFHIPLPNEAEDARGSSCSGTKRLRSRRRSVPAVPPSIGATNVGASSQAAARLQARSITSNRAACVGSASGGLRTFSPHAMSITAGSRRD